MNSNTLMDLAAFGHGHVEFPINAPVPASQGNSVAAQNAGHRPPVVSACESPGNVSLTARSATPAGHELLLATPGESQPESAIADVDCTASASADADITTCYLCQIDGVTRVFASILSLIAEPKLLRNFSRDFYLYFDDEMVAECNSELQSQIIMRDDVKAAFLLCNNVEQTTRTGSSETLDSPGEILFNPLMNSDHDRLFSMTVHGAADHSEIFGRLPRRVRNVMQLSAAGFYLSLAQQKLFCFSCGGGFDRWDKEWQFKNIREFHATIFPSCRFVQQKFAAESVSDCTQKVGCGLKNGAQATLTTYPGLYRPPVTEAEIRAELMLREDLNSAFLEEMRLFHAMDSPHSAQEKETLRALDRQVLECLKQLDQSLGDPLVRTSLAKLRAKILLATRVGTEAMMTTMVQILQDLLSMPSEGRTALAGEITQIIDGVLERDCQDHTSEVIDQIITRMAFVSIHQQMNDEDSSLTVLELLEQLKRLFNESVLFQVLSATMVDGFPLIAHRESVEIRSFLKNELARTVCDFHSNNILQVHSRLGAQPRSRMEQITKAFKKGINNRADFENYLFKLFKTDTSFVNFLKRQDEEFATLLSTTESSAELLLELYSAGNSEQEVLTNTTNLAATREQLLTQDLEGFLGDYVRHYWGVIVGATSKQSQ